MNKIYSESRLREYQQAFDTLQKEQETMNQLSEADKVGIAALDSIMLADMSPTVLRALKYKMREYNMTTGLWKN
jgi:hypothetical protein